MLATEQLELQAFQYHEERSSQREGFTIKARNSGSAPALQVVALVSLIENVSRWALLRLGDLTPEEMKTKWEQVWDAGGQLTYPFNDIPDDRKDTVVDVVLLCSDVLGRRWRFGYARPVSAPPNVEFRRPLAAQVSAITEDHPEHDQWAEPPVVWI